MAGAKLLALTAPNEEPGWQSNLKWMHRAVLVHMAARSLLTLPASIREQLGAAMDSGLGDLWAVMISAGPLPLSTPPLLRVVIIAVALAAFVPVLRRWMTCLGALVLGVEVLVTLPFTANHVWVEFLLLVFFSLLDDREEEEGSLLLSLLRWFIAVMFFYTGLQKVLYGYYFDGQFLAYMAATEDRFAWLFRHFIPAEELARMQSYNEVNQVRPGVYQPRIGTEGDRSGPYRVKSFMWVLMSNKVYLAEMVIGILLLFRRTRVFTTLAGLFFVLMIELGAREITFGLLMTNLFLLFLPGPWIRRCFPFCVAAYGWLVLAFFDLVPMFAYSPA